MFMEARELSYGKAITVGVKRSPLRGKPTSAQDRQVRRQ